jgi:hypothetical protein
MKQVDLLAAVQPPDGWFAVLGLKDGASPKQVLVSTREEFDEVVAQYVLHKRNVYFAVAKYASDANRTKANVSGLKAFWLDIDCGPAKAQVNDKTDRPAGYIDHATGISALKVFCRDVGLPKPLLVNSGRGVHVYWPLEQVVTREEWEPVAKRLQHLCFEHDFYIDPAVFEVARVLRVPGTFNYKDDPPSLVEVLQDANAVDFDEFRTILGAPKVSAPLRSGRELTELGKALRENIEFSFARIMQRSAKGDGCPQLLRAFTEQKTISEPQWFNALSTAKFCKDSENAIHKLSSQHDDYDPGVTERKITHIVGPHGCAVFERDNPGGCATCPHRGQITNPIVLGKTIKEASEADNIVTEYPDGDDEYDGEEAEVHVIPSYPDPFFRGANGGIYRRPVGEETDPILVCEDDLYIVKRMRDPVHGSVVVMKLHTPKDGIREFIVPNAKIADATELRKILAAEDVLCTKKQFDLLMDYIRVSIRELRFIRKAELMRLQFGWADNDTKFIVGDQEVTPEGTFHSPPSLVTANLAHQVRPVGTLEEWKEVFSLYDRPGLEPHAFAALTAFGAPLFKFLGQNGAILNVIHPTSGTGKTTILHMCNSVWGNPKGMLAVAEDTLNAKILRLGVHNNLPFTIDEITNMNAKDFSTLAYNMTQGRGKDRVKQSANELRANLTSWATISLCSSNASFAEKMIADKASPDGELMRLLEYRIDPCDAVDAALGKHMFDHQLMQNYGHAGPIYAEYLVNNLDSSVKDALEVQSRLDTTLNLTQRERFWSSLVASNITGGLIAKRLEIIDWDMRRIYKWALGMVGNLRVETAPPMLDVTAIVGDYINRHMQNILVVKGNVDRRTNARELPSMEPKGELLIRWEPDTKLLFVSTGKFQADCVKYQINYRDTLRRLQGAGIYLRTENKRLSKGMKISSPAVSCLVLDGSKEDFIDVDSVVQAKIEKDHVDGGKS